MTIVLIHGIGEDGPGWSDGLSDILGAPTVEFSYSEILRASPWNRLTHVAAQAALKAYGLPPGASDGLLDHVNDLLVYALDTARRQRIQRSLRQLLAGLEPPVVLIAHSLGSVVAYSTLKNHPDTDLPSTCLITLGSPLSKWAVRKMIHVPNREAPKAQWFNLFGRIDLIGGLIRDLGCALANQHSVQATHSLDLYLVELVRLVKEQVIPALEATAAKPTLGGSSGDLV